MPVPVRANSTARKLILLPKYMEKPSNSIKNWSEDDRPREKMLQRTAAALTDAELLTILISSGTREKSALDLAREVLELANNNLQGLGRLSIAELQKIKGIGEARAITIAAAMELGRRRQLSAGLERMTFTNGKEAAALAMPLLQDLTHEALWVLYLDRANKMIKHEIVSNGGMAGTVVDVRIILKNALLNSSSALIIAHNHPSGNKQPSREDKELTTRLKEAAGFMDIKLLDHIIIAGNDYMSFADVGLL
jgi:DNA repair protein RadC